MARQQYEDQDMQTLDYNQLPSGQEPEIIDYRDLPEDATPSVDYKDLPAGDIVDTLSLGASAPDRSEPVSEQPAPSQSAIAQLLSRRNQAPEADSDVQMALAMEGRNQNQLAALLGKAGSQIGAGIAGLGGGAGAPMPKANTEIFDTIHESAAQPVKDVMLNRQQEAERMQLSSQHRMMDPESDISQQYKAMLRQAFPKMKMPDNLNAHDIQKSGLVSLAQTMTNREAIQQQRADKSREKQELQQDTRFSKLGDKLMSEMASSRSAFGKAANTVRSAEALEQLTGNMNPNDLDTRQITEIARNLDAMLSSGQSTVAGMKKLLPETAMGSASKIQEYIMNMPKGARQGEFVKRMMETVEREKDLAKDQVKRTQDKVLAGYSDLKKKDPTRWEELMQAHGLDADSRKAPKEKGHTVDSKIDGYAKQHGLSYSQAEAILKARGYSGK